MVIIKLWNSRLNNHEIKGNINSYGMREKWKKERMKRKNKSLETHRDFIFYTINNIKKISIKKF